MIVTVTPNAALDRTLQVGRLAPGARVEVRSERCQAGGKGVNVARALHAQGIPVTAVVVVGGAAGAWIVADLERAGIATRAVHAEGESRTCLELIEPEGRVTAIHGRGVRADASVARALRAAWAEAMVGARWIALSGSLAAGLPDDTAARLVADARARGVACAVDSHGPPLPAAAAAGPELLRVNREELTGAFGIEPEAAARDPLLAGVGLGVVSDGGGPVIAWGSAGERYRVEPPPVTLANPVGCGDAMLAGLLARLDAGDPTEAALRFAVALAAADAESPCAGRPDPARARRLEGAVRLASAT